MGSRRMMAMAAILSCLMAFFTSPAGGKTTGNLTPVGGNAGTLTNGDFLRFHVIGNSDSAEDQELKLKVRDGLLEQLDRDLAVYTMAQAEPLEGRVELTREQARTYVSEHLKEIEKVGEQIVRTLGYDYPVRAELEVCEIPEKTYGNVTFPEGQYEALNVTIGDGSGQNWWCCLFPPLCLIGAQPLEGAASTTPTVALPPELEPKYDPLMEAVKTGEPVKLELRFKTLEFLETL